jgi:hypothetical protein
MKVKAQSAAKANQDFFIPREDACYILEELVSLVAPCVTERELQRAVRKAAGRVLRLAAQDHGLPVRFVPAQAKLVAQRLIAFA